MAADMTDETIAQYMERIENFWKAPVTTVKDWYVQTE